MAKAGRPLGRRADAARQPPAGEAIPTEAVARLLRSRCGETPALQRLPAGLTAAAFAFRHAGADFVIRISHTEAAFGKGAYVSRSFGGPGLPVPQVVETGHLGPGHAFCISRRAPGRRLHELDPEAAERRAGASTSSISAIAATPLGDTAGFGPFDADGAGAHATWRDFLPAAPGGEWGHADMATVARMREAVTALSGGCPEMRGLVHGDFGSANLICEGDRITAVIDWTLALHGDPLSEWANLAFRDEPRMRPVLARLSPARALRERLRCYPLRIGPQEIHAAAVQGNPVDHGWLHRRCRQLLAP